VIYLAFLRGVNVGGKSVLMTDLRGMFSTLGYETAKTLLQSGNVAFHVKGRSTAAALESMLERETRTRLGLETKYLIRTADEWDAVVASNPYPKAAKADPARLIAMPLRTVPGAAHVAALRAAIVGRETVEVIGRTAYFIYPDGQGNSKLTINVIEKKLETTGTARNWNTTLKMQGLAREMAE
jgi:uncharacterized protein (DUF1697 family)